MLLMPRWAQHLTGTYQPEPVRRLYLEPRTWLEVRLLRWAYPELPCHRMATARATSSGPGTARKRVSA